MQNSLNTGNKDTMIWGRKTKEALKESFDDE